MNKNGIGINAGLSDESCNLPFLQAFNKIKKGNYILIYTNYVKTLHYICILCKKLLY